MNVATVPLGKFDPVRGIVGAAAPIVPVNGLDGVLVAVPAVGLVEPAGWKLVGTWTDLPPALNVPEAEPVVDPTGIV